MRFIRFLFYFAIGLMLGGFTASAFAATFPAVQVYKFVDIPALASSTYPSLASACSAFSGQAGETFVPNPNGSNSCCNGGSCALVAKQTTCPYGGTVSGATCINVPACDPPAVQDQMTGACVVNNCPSAGTPTGKMSPTSGATTHPDLDNSYAWTDPAVTAKAYGAGGTFCSGGCAVAFQSAMCILPVADNHNCAVLNTSYTGATCSTSGPPSVVPGGIADTPKPPPCDPGQSIIQMGGKLACLPSGQSPDTPKVTKSSSTKTYPDGSTKVTTTTQTCNGAGACSSTTTITNTTATSGPNAGGAGQAGEPGTTIDDTDDEGDTDDFCTRNPDSQMCKGGIAEEGTQKLVLAEVKKLSTVDANTDKTAITNAGKYAETPGYQAAKDADDNLVKYASGVTKNPDVEASKTTFELALSSGFWTEIPSASCTTPTYVIAGHEIEWDRWCEIVGMIQQIGAYGLWVMLAISMFVMLSGGRQS